jgi:hypothetical protein
MTDNHRLFIAPIGISLLVLGTVFLWGGLSALVLALLLSVLEVTLSFDNAVVNAKVLTRMNEVWRWRFLTWGILVAVFGTRLVLPLLIVSASVTLSPIVVAKLALVEPARYQALLEGAQYVISSFGGAFLLMVASKYFFDAEKEVHWIHQVERYLARWGRIEAVEIGATLAILSVLSFFLPAAHQSGVLIAGIVGVILFIFVQGIGNAFSVESRGVASRSVALFVYLNVLDSAFSLDGVVGAFALTNQIIIIVAGLGIGAFFVRTLTVYLVRKRTLETLVYLEHGAHWAIFGLATMMLAGLLIHIPEAIVACVGLVLVGASYIASIRQRRSTPH